MIYEAEPVFGEIYQVGHMFVYHCEYCAASYSHMWQSMVALRVNVHERMCHVKPYRYK